ncbi:hypothetical protein LUZ63_005439 [Rhynchospora breviuscula]|uniref:DUF7903 domain-containing protein n=1 Tax=Rhynchospora breviuscula TaxID=2022672 RepID=A0A9Q0HSK6_9POAL|nr:hypothetical protein LUZ63_005439 [Rhynchospora breviuscula]
MSYVPPHKRHDRNLTPTPVPSSLNPKPFSSPRHHSSKIVYSPCAISRWYSTSSDSETLALVPYDSELIERKYGSKPLTLTVTDEAGLGKDEERAVLRGIVEKVAKNLIETSRYALKEKEREEREDVKLLLGARVGKVLFNGDSSVCLDSIKKASMSEEEGWNKLVHKTFYTDVSEEYIREAEELLVGKFGFKFEAAKEHYHVKIFDKHQPDSTISCKCTASHDGNIELYKIELNQLRYMVTDISCVSKNFDLRIMLTTKKTLKKLDADVANGIDQLISAAVTDSDVKGGLRWPLGKESVADRFVIVGVWHTKYKALSRDKIRVKMRLADRFDYRTSTGEAANEVSFKLSGLLEQLTEDNCCEGKVADMIQGAVDLICDNFLTLGSTCV